MSEAISQEGQIQSREQVALRKLSHIDQPFYHVTRLQNLEMILKDGIVAGNFARKANLDFVSSFFGDSHNKKFVSIGKNPRYFWSIVPYREKVAIIVEPNEVPIPFEPFDEDEFHIKHRISPKEFKGVVIDIRAKEAVANILFVIEKLDSSLAVPIYASSSRPRSLYDPEAASQSIVGELIWPK